MPCDDLPDDLKTLWKETAMDRTMFSPEQLGEAAEKLLANRRKNYLALSVAFATAVAGYTFFVFYFRSTLTRIASTLSIIVFGGFMLDFLLQRARALPDPGETDGVRFYRAELERKRNWHRGLAWRLLVLAVPIVLVDVSLAPVFAKPWPFMPPLMYSWAVALLVILGIWAPIKHRRTAQKYQDRIDELDSAVRTGSP